MPGGTGPFRIDRPDYRVMEACNGEAEPRLVELETSVARRLPVLYRDALDAVSVLERAGDRAAAARFRQEAQAIYGVRWDEEACRRLEQVAARAREAADAPRSGRGCRLRPARLPRP